MIQEMLVGMAVVLFVLGYAEYICRKYIEPMGCPLTFTGIYVKTV